MASKINIFKKDKYYCSCFCVNLRFYLYVCVLVRRITTLMKLIGKQLVFGLAAVAVFGCAKVSAPTGGPKDIDPPVPLRSSPVNYSTNFKGNKFIVEFDEFVDLKNVNQELLVSPPVENKPKVVMRGKKMVVRINNDLADSTTYNFNFFNSITDLNEGNILENFQFEFSTGDTFDSTYMGGIVTDAFTGQPISGVSIMLYRQLTDSTPRTQKPECIGRTNSDGLFIVPNMKADVDYYVFALRDMNNNNKFDLPNESIAFCDSTIKPNFKPVLVYDTITLIDKISRDKKDTVFRDSIYSYNEMVTTIDDISLNLFTEEYHIQYLHDVYRPSNRTIAVAFNDLVDSTFSIKPITNIAFNNDWYIIENKLPTDSVIMWITDSVLYKQDTLKMQVCYTMKDSNNADYLRVDTLEFISKTLSQKQNKKKENSLLSKIKKDDKNEEKKEEKKVSELKLQHNLETDFDLVKNIVLKTNYPIKSYDESLISITKIDEDEKESAVTFKMSRNEENLRSLNIDFKRNEKTKYCLLVPAGALTDVYGNVNDTLKYDFNTISSDYYSSILLNLSNIPCNNAIVQLLDQKEKVLKEYNINGDTKLTIDYLGPDTYIFKLICDDNNNGKWDTGNFKLRQQPERVYYFNQSIVTKSGWDMEYTWKVE